MHVNSTIITCDTENYVDSEHWRKSMVGKYTTFFENILYTGIFDRSLTVFNNMFLANANTKSNSFSLRLIARMQLEQAYKTIITCS